MALVWVCHGSASFLISVVPHGDHALDIQFEEQVDAYYVVYVSSTPDQRGEPAAIWFSAEPVSIDPAARFLTCCVRQIPRNTPRDTDSDGIDDVFELHAPVLDPLDGSDASLDPDGDGMDSLHEYQQGRDPGSPPVPDAAGILCLDLFTPLDPA